MREMYLVERQVGDDMFQSPDLVVEADVVEDAVRCGASGLHP